MAPVLSVRDLRTEIDTENGVVTAVDGVSFDLHANEVLSIVGESGCGKTVTALSILGLLPRRTGRIVGGQVLLGDEDLTKVGSARLRAVRGAEVAMIFQDALTGLNPVHKVGTQIVEMIRAHESVSKKQAWVRAVDLLDAVGIPNPAARADNYVHEFSGGMRQRAMIAMAIALQPKVLIADEPTTALDVTVQAQVLDVLLDVQQRLGTAILLITHDLGVVAGIADRVMVMYAGRKIEEQPVHELFARPQHPYTWGLLDAMPRLDGARSERLVPITGAPPSLISPPEGCRFEPRCDLSEGRCVSEYPELRASGGGIAACHFVDRPDWGRELRLEVHGGAR